MFRRRGPNLELEAIRAAFDLVAVEVDAAQRALLAAIPTSRDPGVPLGQALVAFTQRLDAARRAMPGWRSDVVADQWGHCDLALVEARRLAEQLRLEDSPLGFEALNARVGDILDPLEVVADTERDLRRRR